MLIQETIMCSGVKQSAFSSVADAGAFSKIQIAVSTWPSANDGSRPKGPLQNSYVSYIVLILPMPISGPEDQYQVGRIPLKNAPVESHRAAAKLLMNRADINGV